MANTAPLNNSMSKGNAIEKFTESPIKSLDYTLLLEATEAV